MREQRGPTGFGMILGPCQRGDGKLPAPMNTDLSGSAMWHQASRDDELFVHGFETCELPLPFGHRDHLRLAYVHLTRAGVGEAYEAVRPSLLRYLAHHGVNPVKYHETLTRAWLMAVRHFMAICPAVDSAAAFLETQPRLLNSGIMLKHYTSERLFSEEARRRFLVPDRLPIPEYPT